MFHVLVLTVCLTAYANAGYTSFFYSGFPGTIQSAPVPSGVHYNAAPVTYQSFVPQQHLQHVPQYVQPQYVQPQVQTYSPFPTFHSFGGHGFGYQQGFPQPFFYHTAVHDQPEVTPSTTTNTATSTPAQDTNTATTTPAQDTNPTTTMRPPQAEETTSEYDEIEQDGESVVTNAVFRTTTENPINIRSENLEMNNDNFRGFGYRNEFETGRSHFVFITGPEAYRFPSSAAQQLAPHSSASDAVDTVALPRSAAPTTGNDHSLDALVQYLENPHVGVQRFYSVNNALVARRLEDEIPSLPTHQFASFETATPRTTLPFTQPISPLFPILRSSFQLDAETVKPTEQQEELKEDLKETNEVQHEESASSIETKSVEPENEASLPVSTTAAPASTTEEVTTSEAKASSTTTETSTIEVTTPTAETATTEKAETAETTEQEEEEEKSTMGTIVVE